MQPETQPVRPVRRDEEPSAPRGLAVRSGTGFRSEPFGPRPGGACAAGKFRLDGGGQRGRRSSKHAAVVAPPRKGHAVRRALGGQQGLTLGGGGSPELSGKTIRKGRDPVAERASREEREIQREEKPDLGPEWKTNGHAPSPYPRVRRKSRPFTQP